MSEPDQRKRDRMALYGDRQAAPTDEHTERGLMFARRITYKYGEEFRRIDMLVQRYEQGEQYENEDGEIDTHIHPIGWEIRYSGNAVQEGGIWIVDDEPTKVMHPLVKDEPLGTVRKVIVG